MMMKSISDAVGTAALGALTDLAERKLNFIPDCRASERFHPLVRRSNLIIPTRPILCKVRPLAIRLERVMPVVRFQAFMTNTRQPMRINGVRETAFMNKLKSEIW